MSPGLDLGPPLSDPNHWIRKPRPSRRRFWLERIIGSIVLSIVVNAAAFRLMSCGESATDPPAPTPPAPPEYQC